MTDEPAASIVHGARDAAGPGEPSLSNRWLGPFHAPALTILVAAGFFMSGGGGPPVGAAHDPDGSAASSSPAPDAALLAPAGVTGPVRSARGATPPIGPRAPTQRVALLERRPTTVLQVSAVRAAAVGTLAYRAADALARAGVHAWSTGAPPPSRSV